MDAEKLKAAADAIAILHDAQPEGEKKKPNVDEVEKLAEIDLTAAERDEAWDAYQAQGEDDKPDAAAPVALDSDAPMVTNHYANPMSVQGVTIPPGESRAVPGFDPKHGVVAKWLKIGILSV